ncbi:MAG: PilW family protein [Aquisalimonadaceae bacterium]
MNGYPAIRKQSGLSLVELMVAVVLGLLLMTGIFSVFLASKQTYRLSDAVSRMQENGRFALEMLASDIRMAGHQGCADPRLVQANAATAISFSYPEDAVAGTEGGHGPDKIMVRYGTAEFGELTSSMPSQASEIAVSKVPHKLKDNGLALIADCDSADIFSVSAGGLDRGNGRAHPGSALSRAYNHDNDADDDARSAARLMGLETAEFEVKQTGRSNHAGNPVHALYREGEEVLEGVENLQVKYGVRTGNQVQYVDWSGSIDKENIISVRIGLLLHSIDPVLDADDEAEYAVAGVTIRPAPTGATGPTHGGDRRLRRVFETTVALRNR